VIDDVDDLVFHDFLQRGEIADVPGFRVDVAFDRDVEGIVVTVPVRVVALTEQPGVLLIGELRIMDAVGGIEPHPAGDCYAWHV
jgi:hypothetical protein